MGPTQVLFRHSCTDCLHSSTQTADPHWQQKPWEGPFVLQWPSVFSVRKMQHHVIVKEKCLKKFHLQSQSMYLLKDAFRAARQLICKWHTLPHIQMLVVANVTAKLTVLNVLVSLVSRCPDFNLLCVCILIRCIILTFSSYTQALFIFHCLS